MPFGGDHQLLQSASRNRERKLAPTIFFLDPFHRRRSREVKGVPSSGHQPSSSRRRHLNHLNTNFYRDFVRGRRSKEGEAIRWFEPIPLSSGRLSSSLEALHLSLIEALSIINNAELLCLSSSPSFSSVAHQIQARVSPID